MGKPHELLPLGSEICDLVESTKRTMRRRMGPYGRVRNRALVDALGPAFPHLARSTLEQTVTHLRTGKLRAYPFRHRDGRHSSRTTLASITCRVARISSVLYLLEVPGDADLIAKYRNSYERFLVYAPIQAPKLHLVL